MKITIEKEIDGKTITTEYPKHLIEEFLIKNQYGMGVDEFVEKYTDVDTESFESFLESRGITDDERNELQGEMFEKLEKFIDGLKKKKLINVAEYTIARDILFDCTENHSEISYITNIANEFIQDEKEFIKSLNVGYQDMKKDYPEVDSMTETEINEFSAEYRDCAY